MVSDPPDPIVGTWVMYATSEALDGPKTGTEGTAYSGWLRFHQDDSFEATLQTPEGATEYTGTWVGDENEYIVTYDGDFVGEQDSYWLDDSEVYLVRGEGQEARWLWFEVGSWGGDGSLPPIIWLSILPHDFAAHIGDVVGFEAYGEQQDGSYRTITLDVEWESSNSGVGDINGLGDFTAAELGVTEVVATCGNLPFQTTEVTVIARGPEPAADYYPLGLSYWWQYTGSAVEPAGVQPRQDITLTVSCLRQVVALGETWYELRVAYTDPQVPPRYMYLQHYEDGLHELFLDNSTIDKLRTPIAVGNQWWPDPQEPGHYFVIEPVTEPVEVPAGIFADYVRVREHVVLANEDEFDRITWYVAGIGPVRSGYYDIDPDTQEEVWIGQDLVQYDLGD